MLEHPSALRSCAPSRGQSGSRALLRCPALFGSGLKVAGVVYPVTVTSGPAEGIARVTLIMQHSHLVCASYFPLIPTMLVITIV